MPMDLELQGGSPLNDANINIDQNDIHADRGLLKNTIKTIFNQKIKSKIVVKFASKEKLSPAIKTMVELLPSTCLVNKNLLHFVVGYRNYAAKALSIT